MADVRLNKRRNIMLLCSLLCGIILLISGILNLVDGRYAFGFLELGSLILISIIAWFSIKNFQANFTDLMFSGVMLFLGAALLFYNGEISLAVFFIYIPS